MEHNNVEPNIIVLQQPLVFTLKSLNNQIRRLMERSAILENDANLTGMQYAILRFLSEQAPVTDIYQRDIEAEFNIRRSTASGMLKLLEQKGFILRINDTVDTRLKKITLTAKAADLHQVAKANMERLQIRLLQGISPEEIKEFSRILKMISDNANE